MNSILVFNTCGWVEFQVALFLSVVIQHDWSCIFSHIGVILNLAGYIVRRWEDNAHIGKFTLVVNSILVFTTCGRVEF